MSQRLPIPGQDDGTWGDILNGYLEVAHNSDGTLQPSAIGTAGGVLASNNLSEISSASTARTNLGLGSAATASITTFLQKANNLNDVADAGSSRSNLAIPSLTLASAVGISGSGGFNGGTYTAPSGGNGASFSPFSGYVDGYYPLTGDMVLITGFSPDAANGLWQVQTFGASGTWVRPTEFASGAVVWGRTTTVINGSSNAGSTWMLEAPNGGLTVDTSSQTWSKISPTATTDGADYFATDYGIVTGSTAAAGSNVTALNSLISTVSTNGGGRVILPAGGIYTNAPIIIQSYVQLIGAGWLQTYIRLVANSNCDVVQFYESPSNGISNAFFAGVKNLQLHGGWIANQTPGDFHSGINVTTNPFNTANSADPDFDPTHIIENVWIKGTSGHGYYHNGRSGVRLIACWVENVGGHGYYSSFDTDFVACHAENCGLSGWYMNHGSVRGTANKSYNNGLTSAWTSGQSYTTGQQVYYTGVIYTAKNNITNDTTVPSSDSTNWALAYTMNNSGLAAEIGHGFYFDGCNEQAWGACDAQQNAASAYYLHNCAGVCLNGTVDQVNTGLGLAGASNQGTNPNNYAGVVLDNASNNVIAVTVQNIAPAGYAFRNVNGSANNAVTIGWDGTGINLSSDTTSINPSNAVTIKGQIYTLSESITVKSSAGATPQLLTVANDITLSANAAVSLPTAVSGAFCYVIVRQPSSGGTYNYTASFSGVNWASGNAPTVTTGQGAYDRYDFFCDSTSTWNGVITGQNY